MAERIKITVLLCTRRRPELLRKCLASLSVGGPPAHFQVAVQVIENDERGSCAKLVSDAAAALPFPVHYVLEADVGIAQARNRSLHEGLHDDPDWFVFLDDDEVVIPGWWDQVARAVETFDADVIAGRALPHPSVEIPAWMEPTKLLRRATGDPLETAATNNTLARAHLFRSDGFALRFDPKLRFTGGEYVELFRRATRAGARIVRCNELLVHEFLPAERLTMRYNLKRRYFNTVQAERQVPRSAGHLAGSCGRKIAESVLFLVASPVTMLISRRRGQKLAYKSLVRLIEISGLLAARFGLNGEPYRTAVERPG